MSLDIFIVNSAYHTPSTTTKCRCYRYTSQLVQRLTKDSTDIISEMEAIFLDIKFLDIK